MSLSYQQKPGAGGEFATYVDRTVAARGEVFWVDSNHTNASDITSRGHHPDVPFATIDYAIGQCTASTNSVIFAMPGHAESVIAAQGLDFDVIGVTLIGLGDGGKIPTVTLGTANTATVEVNAVDVTIENIKFISDIADLAVGIDVKAASDGFTFRNNWVTDGAVAKEMVIGLTIEASAQNFLIEGNRFHTVVAGGCTSAIILEGATTDGRIIGNTIMGDWSGAAIAASVAAGVNLVIAENTVNQADAGAGLGINCHAGTTGAIVNNRVLNAKDTVVGVVGAAMLVSENYCSNAAGASGIILPAVDS